MDYMIGIDAKEAFRQTLNSIYSTIKDEINEQIENGRFSFTLCRRVPKECVKPYETVFERLKKDGYTLDVRKDDSRKVANEISYTVDISWLLLK